MPPALVAADPLLLAVIAVAVFFAAAALVLFVLSRARADAAKRVESELGLFRTECENLRDRVGKAEQERAAAMARADQLEKQSTRLQEADARIITLESEVASRKAAAEAERIAIEARVADLTRIRGEMEKDFKNLASAALGESRKSFLDLANEVFLKHRAATGADVEARRKAVEDLIKPIGETLLATRTKLEQIEKERADSFGQIREHLLSVGQEASKLTQALRSNPGARGRWGEQSLRNALDRAGLSPHCDFDTQITFSTVDASLRPDCLIHLPGGRHIVVDAKAPITWYLEGVDAQDEAGRAEHMSKHAASVRQHMLSLAKKEYAQAVSEQLSARPDFVAMYVPGENFFAAAVERNPDLISEGIAKGVFIVTPITLIAFAKAIALGWQQEAIAENAREIAALGRELYLRICKMGAHVQKMGKDLDSSVRSFNSFVGSLESSVLPQARKFRELRVTEGAQTINYLEPIESEAREPVRGRDLLFEIVPTLPPPVAPDDEAAE